MAKDGESSSHSTDAYCTVQALWATIQTQDQRLDQMKKTLQELRRMIAELRVGGGKNPNQEGERVDEVPHYQSNLVREQVFPRRPPAYVDSSSDEEFIEDVMRRHSRTQHRDYKEINYRIKIDIPTFNGHLHIEDFLDWVYSVEHALECMEIPKEKQVKLVAYKLKGGASAWWEQVQINRRRLRKRPISSWHRMKQLMQAQFLPPNYKQMLYQQYLHCRQDNRSVNDYTEEFYRLNARNNLYETENQQIARYVSGLKPKIGDTISLQTVSNLSEAVSLAYKLETQLNQQSQQTHTPQRLSFPFGQI